ncbi:MAG: hypothetical protein JW932_14180 [Deltaproteobacteria bacterium]|nr:hypothetical protein [Deltaproteobacteria bacterium]
MKKTLWISIIFIVVGGLGLMTLYAHPTGSGMMGPGYGPQQQGDWNYCPYCGSYLGGGYGMMGPCMMGRGYYGGMGPGMMGRGYYGMNPGMMGPGYSYGQPYQQQEPMTEKDAKQVLENYLQFTRNPNIKLGKIEDKDQYFEAEIVTKEGSLVDKVTVDKMTGFVRSVY